MVKWQRKNEREEQRERMRERVRSDRAPCEYWKKKKTFCVGVGCLFVRLPAVINS